MKDTMLIVDFEETDKIIIFLEHVLDVAMSGTKLGIKYTHGHSRTFQMNTIDRVLHLYNGIQHARLCRHAEYHIGMNEQLKEGY